MKLRAILILICLLAFYVNLICSAAEEAPEWLFDNQDEIKNWGGMNQMAPLKLDKVKDQKGDTRTVLITESLGGDPYVFPDGGWGGFNPALRKPFDGKKYNTIYMGARVNVASAWQIYFVTDEDGAYSERQVQNFQVNAVDVFEDYQFKMTNGGWTQEQIMGFRLDPGTVAGVKAEIDYLSLRGIPAGVKPKSVDNSGKLAVTWGKVKN
ncbi:hypothetical protein FJZ33_07320 [Candidatus Poribacteria bacterium]|nr:hypothetical protein [Candidatus Poribacteria bacterium]